MRYHLDFQWVLQQYRGLSSFKKFNFILINLIERLPNKYIIYFMFPKPNYLLISLILSVTFLLSGCAAGLLGGQTSYSDRRTTESQITDEKLEWQTVIKTQDVEGEFRVNFVSYNQVILITGQSPNQEIIDKFFYIFHISNDAKYLIYNFLIW